MVARAYRTVQRKPVSLWRQLFALDYSWLWALALAVTFSLITNSVTAAGVERYFDQVRDDPVLLRQFLYRFPKGGDLHSHLDGAVYAESYIQWAAEDGKCIEFKSMTITLPPCSTSGGRPPVADTVSNPDTVNRMIDAFSIRNYERRPVSGHDQFFSTFDRYSKASRGRQGSMLAEVTRRAAQQNVGYLELMESTGMRQVRKLAAVGGRFKDAENLRSIAASPDFQAIVEEVIEQTDEADRQWREDLGCEKNASAAGCGVEFRYIAQVIRVFPPEQVLAQTLLAYALIDRDPRYVGLNFVAPEDNFIATGDYTLHMNMIRDVGALFPHIQGAVTLHAGELAMSLVPPESLLGHIREAVNIAGAVRVGHGVDIIHEEGAASLLVQMAREKILVEINLTSNAVILGVEGDNHPFNLYRSNSVPLALSTDDEGVSRIDLTHEYQRAVQTYDLDYDYLKELSRNSLAYSFLSGDSLFIDIPRAKRVKPCARDTPGETLSAACGKLIGGSEKARMQWQLEERLQIFEDSYR